VADVLLYSLALMLELGSLVALRVREPDLRGAFRIPLGTGGVADARGAPVQRADAGRRAQLRWTANTDARRDGRAVAIALGPLCYSLARRHARRGVTDPA
jgi:hypothetical protein